MTIYTSKLAPAVLLLIHLCLLALLDAVSAQSTSSQCLPGFFSVSGSSVCTACNQCDSPLNSACGPQCYCTASSTASCGASDKTGFCASRSVKLAGASSTVQKEMCASCSALCDGADTAEVSLLSSGAAATAVNADKDCPTTCQCSVHSDCPSNYFCGASPAFKGISVCRQCNDCTDALAVDAKCPQAQCQASFACNTTSECTGSSWCANNFQCQTCSSACYVPQGSRNTAAVLENTLSSRSGTCAESCCGWDTMEAEGVTSSNTMQFMFGACSSETYSTFSAYYRVGGTATSSSSNTSASPTTPTEAESQGYTECKVTIDDNPVGSFPRRVPVFSCSNMLSECTSSTLTSMVVFAMPSAAPQTPVVLATKQYSITTRTESCSSDSSTPSVVQAAVVVIIILSIALCAACIGQCVSGCREKDSSKAADEGPSTTAVTTTSTVPPPGQETTAVPIGERRPKSITPTEPLEIEEL